LFIFVLFRVSPSPNLLWSELPETKRRPSEFTRAVWWLDDDIDFAENPFIFYINLGKNASL
jgi:hypothetical protein